MRRFSKLLAVLLALSFVLFPACREDPEPPVPPDGPRTEDPGKPEPGPDVEDPAAVKDAYDRPPQLEQTADATDITDETERKDKQKKMLEGMLALQQENSDTMGWLFIPETTIDDAVVKVSYNDGNAYYLRRNARGEKDFYGCYYADYRCYAGKRESLSRNTVIYGHSMTENPDGVKFSQLKKYLDPEFARSHPYICFSTIEEDMIWQIFSIFYTDTGFNYIQGNPSDGVFTEILKKAKSLSIYDYGLGVTPKDKILTLSTCTYRLPNGTKLNYPNDYRYVVMAKLLDKKAPLSASVELTATPNAPVPEKTGKAAA